MSSYKYFWTIWMESRSLGPSLEHRCPAIVCYVEIMSRVLKKYYWKTAGTLRQRRKANGWKWVKEWDPVSLQMARKRRWESVRCAGSCRSSKGLCQESQILFCSLKQLEVLGLPGAATESFDHQELSLIFIKHYLYAKYCAWDFSCTLHLSSCWQRLAGTRLYNPLSLFRKQA